MTYEALIFGFLTALFVGGMAIIYILWFSERKSREEEKEEMKIEEERVERRRVVNEKRNYSRTAPLGGALQVSERLEDKTYLEVVDIKVGDVVRFYQNTGSAYGKIKHIPISEKDRWVVTSCDEDGRVFDYGVYCLPYMSLLCFPDIRNR